MYKCVVSPTQVREKWYSHIEIAIDLTKEGSRRLIHASLIPFIADELTLTMGDIRTLELSENVLKAQALIASSSPAISYGRAEYCLARDYLVVVSLINVLL